VADKEAIKNVLGGWIEKNSDKPIEVLVNNAGHKRRCINVLDE
jgi:3-oxoacyl-[acyl-carrier protein] reductase